MTTAAPALVSFSAGEFSPLMAGRINFDKYPAACETLENFLPTVQGPVIKRAGTRYVAPIKDSTKRAWLTTFEFNVTNAYVVEFGDLYVRFFTQHAQLVSGTPVEVVTPYAQASLFDSNNICRIRTAQSGDLLYINHGDYEPRTLKRTTSTTFAIDTFRPIGGPFKDQNITPTTVYASAATGSITLNASAAIFLPGHVNALFLLESKDTNSIMAWEPGKAVLLNDLRRVGRRVYQALNAATTGTETPVHTEGAYFDGNAGVQWQFSDAGFGYVRIDSYVSPTQVNATVISPIPVNAVGSGNPTTRWAHGAWSTVEGWPTDVAFFRERLVFARGQTLWLSTAGGFDDFSARNANGEIVADQAITITIASGKINDIQWVLADKYLLAGTAGAEFSIGELSNGQPLGPGNIRAQLQSQFGTRPIVPVQAGASIMFVQRAGRKMREILYNYTADGYQSFDRSVLAEHITKTGVVDMDYAQEPYSIVWCTRADGRLAAFTWNSEQNVWAWHNHTIGGGAVESVAAIPSPDGSRNELWLIVNRTIGGVTKRYVEFMEAEWAEGVPQSSAFYVDSGLTYSGVSVNTVTGLGHLIGQTVKVLVDGSTHPDRVVSVAGSIALQRPGAVVQAGLPYAAKLKTMRIEAGAQNGTAQGKTKRFSKVTFRVLNSSSGQFGATFEQMDTITYRIPSDQMNQPVPLFTGDKLQSWPGGYETAGQIAFYDDLPLPLTLVAILPIVSTEDAR